MSAKRMFSLFISSTYEDLREERQALMGVALESSFIPVGMEQFHAAPVTQWDVITRMIDECDFYLLMIGGRYGSIDAAAGISYTEKEYAQLTEETSGTYSGIGALLSQDPDTKICTVLKVFRGSPAEEAGLKDGDILVSADGHEITGEDLDYFVSTYIRGPENTEVELVVLRGEKREEVTLNITRKSIDTPTVEWKMLDNKAGYIAVSQFDIVTPDQFEKAVNELTEQGMTSLVIDLRNNPGGVVQSATRMLDYMLPDGLLVYTAGRSGVGEKFYATDDHEVDIPTAILINGHSASASEIFAGAYKDYGKAKLVGTTTFGKGIVQFVLPLGDGSAVKITTQHYYTPNGFDLHGKGIEPDIKAEPGEDDVIGSEKDAQLEAALKAIAE